MKQSSDTARDENANNTAHNSFSLFIPNRKNHVLVCCERQRGVACGSRECFREMAKRAPHQWRWKYAWQSRSGTLCLNRTLPSRDDWVQRDLVKREVKRERRTIKVSSALTNRWRILGHDQTSQVQEQEQPKQQGIRACNKVSAQQQWARQSPNHKSSTERRYKSWWEVVRGITVCKLRIRGKSTPTKHYTLILWSTCLRKCFTIVVLLN